MIFKKVLQPNRWILLCMSAFYTFYTMVISVLNLVKFRKLGSPILSAAKVLNFIAAMMSILGLQTAMISRFSENGEAYRKMTKHDYRWICLWYCYSDCNYHVAA